MATDTKKNPAEPAGFVRPNVQVNLMAKYPKYAGCDARVTKEGTKAPPIHGLLLGTVDLPKTIRDPQTGELKDWTAFVLELKQPALCKHPDEEDAKMFPAGTKIVLTMSKALERDEFRKIANHPKKVFEVLIEPEVSKTSEGLSLWIYPTFGVINMNGIDRDAAKHSVSVHGILDGMLGDAPQLPTNGAPFKGATA